MDLFKTEYPVYNYSQYEDTTDALRQTNQKKQYDYYIGNIYELEQYLNIALKKMYEEESISSMRFSYMNITKKIINQLAVLYKEPAKRYVKVNGKISQEWTDYYNNILPEDVHNQDKMAHRYAKLHNTVLPHIYFDSNKGRWAQETLSSYYYDVESADLKTADSVKYSREFIINGEKVVYDVYHTKDEIYILDENDVKLPLPGSNSIQNPYGALDFIVFRMEDSSDFWGTGADVLVEGNEEINFYLTKLGRDDIVLGTAGMLFGINLAKGLGIDINNPNESGDLNLASDNPTLRKVKGGRNAIINVETSMQKTIQPDLKYISTNPQIPQVLEAIDWKIKSLALSYGLNPNSFSTNSKVESGFSRVVARYEQMEVRREDIPSCRRYERDRFNFIRLANNNLVGSNYAGTEKLKKIPEDAELIVEFGEVEIPATTQDLWFDRRMQLRYGQKSMVDFLQEDNPQLSDKDAQTMIDKNLEKYRKFLIDIGEVSGDINQGLKDGGNIG